MTHEQFSAVEKFAEKLKTYFPIILRPKDFSDRVMNIASENSLRRIDMALEQAKWEFAEEEKRMAVYYGAE